jgi:hypothetical protein
MGALTVTETAQTLDHLGYENIDNPSTYVQAYVLPQLAQLTNDAALVTVRAHLDRLNAIYAEQSAIISKFKLKEVKGIVFAGDGEVRLWGMYCMWVKKLAVSLDLKPNPELYGSGGGGRPIV